MFNRIAEFSLCFCLLKEQSYCRLQPSTPRLQQNRRLFKPSFQLLLRRLKQFTRSQIGWKLEGIAGRELFRLRNLALRSR